MTMRDWGRHEEAKRLKKTGLTLKEVGEALCVSRGRVHAMLKELENRDRRIAREAEYPSLAPWHRGLKYSTWSELESKGFKSREECMLLAGDLMMVRRKTVALPGWKEEMEERKWSGKTLKLSMVNEVRAWLGLEPYVPSPRIASDAELKRAQRLLEQNGWRVEPP